MNTTQHIAIAEATNELGKAIVRKLSRSKNRLLLLADRVEDAENFKQQLLSDGATADMQPVNCAHDACWEADVVVLTLPCEQYAEAASRIGEVVTGKCILCVSPDRYAAEQLRKLLPHSYVLAWSPLSAGSLGVHTEDGVQHVLDELSNLFNEMGIESQN